MQEIFLSWRGQLVAGRYFNVWSELTFNARAVLIKNILFVFGNDLAWRTFLPPLQGSIPLLTLLRVHPTAIQLRAKGSGLS
jgi:hypothetical protein